MAASIVINNFDYVQVIAASAVTFHFLRLWRAHDDDDAIKQHAVNKILALICCRFFCVSLSCSSLLFAFEVNLTVSVLHCWFSPTDDEQFKLILSEAKNQFAQWPQQWTEEIRIYLLSDYETLLGCVETMKSEMMGSEISAHRNIITSFHTFAMETAAKKGKLFQLPFLFKRE